LPKGLYGGLKMSAGRNVQGRQTFFHQGGGLSHRYRYLDFYRQLRNIPAIVRRIDYDPVRTAAVALLSYANEILTYILAPQGLTVGAILRNCESRSLDDQYYFSVGSAHHLAKLPAGTFIHAVEPRPGRGATLLRAFNSAGQLLRRLVHNHAVLKLRSGEYRRIPASAIGVLGVPSRIEHKQRQNPLRKAGLNRRAGRRPIVRGCAMNPVDHPHGGNTSSKFGSFTPWGKIAKWRPTARIRLSSRTVLQPRLRASQRRLRRLGQS
jgi:large subunit ribosomal protein L2